MRPKRERTRVGKCVVDWLMMRASARVFLLMIVLFKGAIAINMC